MYIANTSRAELEANCCCDIVNKKLDVLISLYATLANRIERTERSAGATARAPRSVAASVVDLTESGTNFVDARSRGNSSTDAADQAEQLQESHDSSGAKTALHFTVIDDLHMKCAASDTHFALSLLRTLYTKKELTGKAVNGTSKKDPLSPTRMNYIKRTVKQKYFPDTTDQDYAQRWKRCVAAINNATNRYTTYSGPNVLHIG